MLEVRHVRTRRRTENLRYPQPAQLQDHRQDQRRLVIVRRTVTVIGGSADGHFQSHRRTAPTKRGDPAPGRCHRVLVGRARRGRVTEALRLPPDTATYFGHPAYFMTILGVGYRRGGRRGARPRVPRLKEWAYAVSMFNYTSAAPCTSGLLMAPKRLRSAGFVGLTAASWALWSGPVGFRPQSPNHRLQQGAHRRLLDHHRAGRDRARSRRPSFKPIRFALWLDSSATPPTF